MRLAALKRWHWMTISLVVGLIVAWVRGGDPGDIHGEYVEGYGNFLGGQQLFESALTDMYEGRPRLTDIMVYRRRVSDNHGGERIGYIVAGDYRRPVEDAPDHHVPMENRVFIVTQVPYEPMADLSAYNKPGGPDYDKAFRDRGTAPSVLDFLATMREAAGVEYQYAWWDAYPYLVWPLLSFLLVGMVWPTAVNLLSFGKLKRPPEAKGISLWNVRNVAREFAPPAPVAAPAVAVPADEEPAPLEQAPTEPAAAAPAAVPGLSVEIPPVLHDSKASSEHKEFGKGDEDFYPTERHAHHGE